MGPEIALIATVASAGIGAVGAIQQGQAGAAQAQYQSQVARNNQIVADQNARYQATAAATKAQAEDMKQRAVLGSIEASQGASGIAFDSPTMEQIRESQRQVGRLTSRTVFEEGMQDARQSSQAGRGFEAEGQLARMRGASASAAGTMGAFSSLLSGATSFSDKWSKFKVAGVPGY